MNITSSWLVFLKLFCFISINITMIFISDYLQACVMLSVFTLRIDQTVFNTFLS